MNLNVIKKQVTAAVQQYADGAITLSHKINAFAETAFKETQSSQAVITFLRSNGFKIDPIDQRYPTAFRASYGKGKPVIGVLGEYDALPDCGLEPGTDGHGCGHDVLGAGSALGAVATAHLMKEKKLKGTVVYYGCPAEELLAGKVFMARDGAFRDLDICIAWHPVSGESSVNLNGCSAMDSIVFEFTGRTAHAAYAEHGRSALDGVMLMDVAVNYLREHIPENIRIHMVIPDGGKVPNVVPDHASAWYFIRGKDRPQVDAIRKRVIDCAKGAALSTGTSMKWRMKTGLYNRLPNETISRFLLDNLNAFSPLKVTEEDRRRARKFGFSGDYCTTVKQTFGAQERVSTDEDNVSWIAPLGRFNITAFPIGTPGHHRLQAQQGTAPFADRGLIRSAEVIALSAVRLMTEKKTADSIVGEFKIKTKGFTYDPLIKKNATITD